MNSDEKMLWDLFCSTGEPRYYSMYVKARGEEAQDTNSDGRSD